MAKKFLSILLCLLLLASLSLPVLADETESEEKKPLAIYTASQFLSFAENCRKDSYSKDLTVVLQKDIDLSDHAFEGIPIFCGTFDGNGHTISGVSIGFEGSHLGLFRYLAADAAVSDLTVEGSLKPQGSQQIVGGIAGENRGTIENCVFRGEIEGSDHVGGIAGDNTVSGVISESTVFGTVSGNHFVGGIAGTNSGVVRNCVSQALVNTTAKQNTVDIADITMESMMGSEAVYTTTDIGGIVGHNAGVIRKCENKGNVGYQSIGYNVGGIAGSQLGFITESTNHGSVYGRKEVGGIAGQMEPVTNIEYTQDTLQILKGQLGTMASLANRASANADSGAADVSGYIAGVQDSVWNAQEAITTLAQDGVDLDSLMAAESVLYNSMHSIESNVSGAAYALYDTVGTLASDMRAISNQIGAMQNTINEASENLGGTITDISDLDTLEDFTGKVSLCDNHGSVTGDANIGGIAGAIALENDMDAKENLDIIGEESLNYDSELRAVIRSCTNHGSVLGKKQNIGGIVGWMHMGLAKECISLGTVDGEEAEYAGGIAGLSTGFIRDSYAKCLLRGDDYVGGIAGSADTVTNCRSMVSLSGTERTGAVIGYTTLSQEKASEEEELPPIWGNLYTPIHHDAGGIDGISYTQVAEALPMESFLVLEDLPDALTYFTVRFEFASGTVQNVNVVPNAPLTESQIPNLAIVDGRNAHWVGLHYEPITFDCTIQAVYDPMVAVLQSQESIDGKPILLADGAFLPDAAILISPAEETPAPENMGTVLESISFTVPECEEAVTIHYLTDAEGALLYRKTENGDWTEISYRESGSYILFEAEAGNHQIALVQKPAAIEPVILLAAAVGILIVVVLLVKRKKK